MKITNAVDSEEDCYRLQEDINGLVRWAEKWQMEFNPEKCEVMHLSRSNKVNGSTINGSILRDIEQVRILGVNVHRSQKVAGQVDKVVKKAHGIPSFISQGMEYNVRKATLERYKILVRPQLEHCEQFWSPHDKKDVSERRLTGMLPGQENCSQEEKIVRLGLFSLV